MRTVLTSAMIVLITILGANNLFATGNVDHDLWAELLEKYVHDGKVNYQGFKTDEATLDTYLDTLARVDPTMLSRNDQFAFCANAYNAWTVKLILSAYPDIRSIKELGSLLKSPWKKKLARIDGKLITLDNIEHDILRPHFQEPRVHFAINCAAKSCPPLASEPFVGSNLDDQLNRLTRAFVNDSDSNYLRGNVLYVSSIFKWFKKDFKAGIIPFFLQYAESDLKSKLEQIGKGLKIKYLDYDWSLNGT